MSLVCRILGHEWRLVGGIARNAGPTTHPPHVTYNCSRCRTIRNVEGITTQIAQERYYRDPDAAETAARKTEQ